MNAKMVRAIGFWKQEIQASESNVFCFIISNLASKDETNECFLFYDAALPSTMVTFVT